MPTRESLVKELSEFFNKHHMEQLYGANVPDFVLGEVALTAVEEFLENFALVTHWYGVHLEPGNKYFEE